MGGSLGGHSRWLVQSERQEVLRNESDGRRCQAAEAAEHQARSDQEHQRQRGFASHEQTSPTGMAKSRSGRGRPVRGPAQARAQRLARGPPGRDEPEADSTTERDQEVEGQHWSVEMDGPEIWQPRVSGEMAEMVCRLEGSQKIRAPPGHQQGKRAGNRGEHQALQQEATNQVTARGPQSQTDGHLVLAGYGPCQQQMRDIDTGDQQHEVHRRQQDPQRTADGRVGESGL